MSDFIDCDDHDREHHHGSTIRPSDENEDQICPAMNSCNQSEPLNESGQEQHRQINCLTDCPSDCNFHVQTSSGHPVSLTVGKHCTRASLLLVLINGAYPPTYPRCEHKFSNLNVRVSSVNHQLSYRPIRIIGLKSSQMSSSRTVSWQPGRQKQRKCSFNFLQIAQRLCDYRLQFDLLCK